VAATEPFLLAYNTKLVPTPITGYQDLLRPEFKGKIGTVEAVSATVVAWYDWLEKTQGPDYLQKLAAQSPRIHGGGAVQNAQSVAAGETLVTSFTIMTIASPLVDQGAPIKMVQPNPSLGTRALGVVPSWATRPNAAQVFLDYVMSVRGQSLLMGKGEAASALPNVPGAMDGRNITPYDPTPYTPEFVKTYLKRWHGLFTGK
jgi:iron(III) transport system substrate-binding protein